MLSRWPSKKWLSPRFPLAITPSKVVLHEIFLHNRARRVILYRIGPLGGQKFKKKIFLEKRKPKIFLSPGYVRNLKIGKWVNIPKGPYFRRGVRIWGRWGRMGVFWGHPASNFEVARFTLWFLTSKYSPRASERYLQPRMPRPSSIRGRPRPPLM